MDQNVVFNPNFKLGLRGWQSNSCMAFLSDGSSSRHPTKGGSLECVVTHRKETWQGLEQELTPRLKRNVKYNVMVMVKICNSSTSKDVKATLRLENVNGQTTYLSVGKVKARGDDWSKIQGHFCLDNIPKKAVFYIEGPPPSVDILIKYVDVRPCTPNELGQHSVDSKNQNCTISQGVVDVVLRNSNFEQGLECWFGKCCKALLLDSSTFDKESTSRYIACLTNRTSAWNGIEQDITGRIKGNTKYEVSASVRIRGEIASSEVLATLWIKDRAQKEHYITLGRTTALSTGWVQLEGKVMLNATPEKAAAYIEGPPAGIDLLINSFSICSFRKPPPVRPVVKDPKYGVNIVENFSFSNGLNGWSPLGQCSLCVNTGALLILPNAARDSLNSYAPITGYYVTAKNRKHIWEGPSQNIGGKIKLFVTYQVSAWVRIGHGGMAPQKVNVALGVDGQWVNGGEVEGDASTWKEIAGSFRFEKEPDDVLLYVQGPSANVDLMVANLMVFAVDRTARFDKMKARTEKVRKRATVIRVTNKKGLPLPHGAVTIKQTKNTFPLGSCINSYSLNNDTYVNFFFDNFNWAVFENELKWYWTEKERNKLNYKEADELCKLCIQHGIPMRGHCIFWETDDAVQDWVKELDDGELASCVQNRLVDLLSRFRGKFEHYDVNNEMLHGCFYRNRLGAEILPYMFKLAQQFDPAPKLFVNDYHVEDGYDMSSSPQKYIDQILELQAMGAPVGGIGVQGHMTYPVGPIISNALDKLAVVGLPIWFTEVDVETTNEFLRSEDLEVVLREAYAHPAVEGVMLWGFLALKREWQTAEEGKTNDMGCFHFRVYHGKYTVTVQDANGKKYEKGFEISKGDDVLFVDVNI